MRNAHQRSMDNVLILFGVWAFLSAYAAARTRAAEKAVEKALGKFDDDLEGA